MSTRSRARPWFLERPEIFRPRFSLTRPQAENPAVRAWLGILTDAMWSWDGFTWFDAGGRCVRAGTDEDYGFPTRRWREREDAAALARRTVIADLLGTSFISVVS